MHAGIDVSKAIGAAPRRTAPHWILVTPVGGRGALATYKFYRSVVDYVDDDEKRRSFGVVMNALGHAAQQSNYQEVLRGSQVDVKSAHNFTYGGQTHKVWELKYNKKDRVYFFPLQVRQGAVQRSAIVLLLAYHKKDQTTPKDVALGLESVMRKYLDPRASIEICRE